MSPRDDAPKKSPRKNPRKKRIDVLLVERGIASSRERAQGLILSGNVLVNDVPVTKAGHLVPLDATLRLREKESPYVSRGGIKLAAALDAFTIHVDQRTALDIGASTGGFSHVLLLRGARKVHALDVGHGQLDWKLRSDPRVIVHEKINARSLEFAAIGEKVGIIVVDVSFISLNLILPSLAQFADPDTDWVTLIKPQFEVGREHVGKGGIVTSSEAKQRCLERVKDEAERVGIRQRGLIESPITGTDGNTEYLAHWRLS